MTYPAENPHRPNSSSRSMLDGTERAKDIEASDPYSSYAAVWDEVPTSRRIRAALALVNSSPASLDVATEN
jgi:hypothetical protein